MGTMMIKEWILDKVEKKEAAAKIHTDVVTGRVALLIAFASLKSVYAQIDFTQWAIGCEVTLVRLTLGGSFHL